MIRRHHNAPLASVAPPRFSRTSLPIIEPLFRSLPPLLAKSVPVAGTVLGLFSRRRVPTLVAQFTHLCTEGASPCHRGSLLLPSSVKFNTIISRILELNGSSVVLVNTIGLCVPANMIPHSIAISLPAPFLEIHTLFNAHCYCHVFLYMCYALFPR